MALIKNRNPGIEEQSLTVYTLSKDSIRETMRLQLPNQHGRLTVVDTTCNRASLLSKATYNLNEE